MIFRVTKFPFVLAALVLLVAVVVFVAVCWRFYVTQIFALLTNTAKAAKNLA